MIFNNFFYIYKFILFIYFWLRWVFAALRRLSLVAASWDYSSLQCLGFSWRWLLLLQSTGSRRAGFSSCGTQAQQFWRTGLVALRHAGSSRTRDRTCVPCIGRRILNHCTTREVPKSLVLYLLTIMCLDIFFYWLYIFYDLGNTYKRSANLSFKCPFMAFILHFIQVHYSSNFKVS